MATGILVSEEQYLHTTYEPDCEFEDGILIERNLGTKHHSKLQAFLCACFLRRRKEWGIHVFVEQRIRVRSNKYMIPDVCVYLGAEPAELVFQSPPLLWIEILSPKDRTVRVNRKIQEALDFGAPYVWVIDPETLESELHTTRGRSELADGVLLIPGTPIEVPLKSIFED